MYALVIAAVLVVAGLAWTVPQVRAQNAKIDLDASGAIRDTLTAQNGKRVRLKLSSGQDLEGTVASVGNNAVALTALTSMDYYNATVRLDHVAAVIVRRDQP